MFKFRKKREKGHEYNLTYDNLAVPEIHTHEPVSYTHLTLPTICSV